MKPNLCFASYNLVSRLFILVFLLIPKVHYGQNAFSDSKQLDSVSGKNKNIKDAYTFYRVLANYYPVIEQPVSFVKIYTDFAPNPYLSPELGQATNQLLDSLNNIVKQNDQIKGFYELSQKSKSTTVVKLDKFIKQQKSSTSKELFSNVKENIETKKNVQITKLFNEKSNENIDIKGKIDNFKKLAFLITQREIEANELMLKIRSDIAKTIYISPKDSLPNLAEFTHKWYPFRYATTTAHATELTTKIELDIKELTKTNTSDQIKKKAIIAKAYRTMIDTFLLSATKIYRDIAYGEMVKSPYQKEMLAKYYPAESVSLHNIEAQIDSLTPTINQPIYNTEPTLARATFFTNNAYRALTNPKDNSVFLADLSSSATQRTQMPIPSWQAVAIDGLSMFVAERLQEELNAAFFQRFSAILNDPRYNDIQLLFPATHKLLTRGSNDYTSIIQLLRSAFRQDLAELMFNFTEIVYSDQATSRPLRTIHTTLKLNTPANKTRLQQLRYVYIVLLTLREAARGTHPAELLNTLSTVVDNSKSLIEDRDGMQLALQRLTILSNAIRQNSGLESGWVSKDQIQKLTKNERQYRFFLGLIYQQLNHLGATDPLLYDTNQLQGAVLGFSSLATQMEQHIEVLRQRANDTVTTKKLKAQDYEPLYRTLLATAEFTESRILHRPVSLLAQQHKLSDAILEGYIAAGEGRYGVTVANLLMVVTTILPPDEILRLVEKKSGSFSQNITLDQRQQLAQALLALRNQLSQGSSANTTALWASLETILLTLENTNLKENMFLELPPQALFEVLKQVQARYNITDINSADFDTSTVQSYKVALQKELPKAGQAYVAVLKKQYYSTANTTDKLLTLNTWALEYGVDKAASPVNIPQLIRYGQFMAAVAEARKAEDVREALKAAALPTGSSSIKRQTFCNISLNAYAGLNTGAEWLQGEVKNNLFDHQNLRAAAGFTAPIGVAFSWGLSGDVGKAENRHTKLTLKLGTMQKQNRSAIQGKISRTSSRLNRISRAYQYYGGENQQRYLRGTSLTAFISIIDIGAPVQFRLNPENSTASLPEGIDFKQILAPGIFAVYGFRNSPLSIIAGGQFNPLLRQVKDSTANVEKRDAFRLSAGLVIDIPMFNLFSRTERRGSINYWRGPVQFNSNGETLNHKATHPQYQSE